MGDEDDGRARGAGEPEAMQILDQPAACDAVEGGEGLVEEQKVRLGDEGAGKGDAHGHAAGQLARAGVEPVAEADGGQGPGGAGAGLGTGHAGQLQRQGDIGQGVGPGHEGGQLEDEAGAAPGPLHGAFGRRLQPRQQAQEGGLASAGRADDGDDLAGGDGQVDGAERCAAGIADQDAVQRRRGVSSGHGQADTGW